MRIKKKKNSCSAIKRDINHITCVLRLERKRESVTPASYLILFIQEDRRLKEIEKKEQKISGRA